MIQRSRQELDRVLSHRLNPHPGASIAYKTNDRNIALLRLKPCLQFQTRDPRHLHFSYQLSPVGWQRSSRSRMPASSDAIFGGWRAIQSIDSRRAASVVSDGRSTDSNESGSLRATRISTE